MGGKHSKGKMSQDDLQYLLKNTRNTKEEIKVCKGKGLPPPSFKFYCFKVVCMLLVIYFVSTECNCKTKIMYFIWSCERSDPQEWHQGFLEDCPDGELTKTQFVEMYTKIFPGGNAEKFSENVFRTFDTDRSGTIDFREFMLALHVTSAGTPEEKLQWAFRMYDVDGNGEIDFNEMKR